MGWGIQTLNVPQTWKYSQGEGITIAVIDSGCDLSHNDLHGNLLDGMNFVQKKALPNDDCGHGSHITGIVCALNNNLGIVGVAPKAKVIPIKVLDEDGNGEMKDVAKAIRYATERKVDFILMSLGCPTPLQQVRKAIQAALNEGIVTFVAAGNMGKSEHLLYPANYKETISVGAIDAKMRRADFNNTGSNLDFLAPGVDILSTVPKNWYAIMSGSSQAAPFVLGLAALLKSYKEERKLNLQLNGPDDYREVFKKYTINVVGENYAGNESKFYQGFGVITPDKLMEMANANPKLFT